VIWSGDNSSIPKGWTLCDGANGTPDLRDRFVEGVGTQDPGYIGGSHSVQLLVLPKHNHYFQTDNAGSHQHVYYDAYGLTKWKYFGLLNNAYLAWPGDVIEYEYVKDNGNHYHTGVTANEGNSEPFDNRPSYYRMAFIMKL